MKLYGFELPNAFSSIIARLTSPPRVGSAEARPVQTATANPLVQFYNPDDLQFANRSKPLVPDNGGYVTAGVGMVQYGGQPIFNRNVDPGPVREFFGRVTDTLRLRQL